jgi:histidyl-tRNA synthetase
VEIDPLLVRGLDYYNRTVFEIVPTDDERAQSTIGAGGRYDGLIETLGGPPTPAVGFGCGIERLILEMQRNEVQVPELPGLEAFIVHRAEGGAAVVTQIAGSLRRQGIAVVVGETGRSMKSQLRAPTPPARASPSSSARTARERYRGQKDLRASRAAEIPLANLPPSNGDEVSSPTGLTFRPAPLRECPRASAMSPTPAPSPRSAPHGSRGTTTAPSRR